MSKYVGLIEEANTQYQQHVTDLFDYLEELEVFSKDR